MLVNQTFNAMKRLSLHSVGAAILQIQITLQTSLLKFQYDALGNGAMLNNQGVSSMLTHSVNEGPYLHGVVCAVIWREMPILFSCYFLRC